jgi:hypothetical protein
MNAQAEQQTAYRPPSLTLNPISAPHVQDLSLSALSNPQPGTNTRYSSTVATPVINSSNQQYGVGANRPNLSINTQYGVTPAAAALAQTNITPAVYPSHTFIPMSGSSTASSDSTATGLSLPSSSGSAHYGSSKPNTSDSLFPPSLSKLESVSERQAKSGQSYSESSENLGVTSTGANEDDSSVKSRMQRLAEADRASEQRIAALTASLTSSHNASANLPPHAQVDGLVSQLQAQIRIQQVTIEELERRKRILTHEVSLIQSMKYCFFH